ncbi:AbrB/MazE/SpoVT family DNA-binding domain-containing protein [Duganella sp. P38]|uniref:AbrB/MazE/SpoVT family DNA-binding domain-containing protein n=1 Tax=Duganella sp. P38 TaxID=3423949 RepID=UPI003D7BFFD9
MARLTRWGNSDGGLRLPKHILEAAGLRVGDEIGCRMMDDGTIRLTPCKGRIEISKEHESMKVSRAVLKW